MTENGLRFHTFLTHHRPHLDEIGAIWLMRKVGEKEFPGVIQAKVEYCDAGPRTPNGQNWKDWHERGYILIGVGGGRFDEHPAPGQERKRDHCAMTLVARALGVEDDPSLKPIIEVITQDDLSGSPGILSLGHLAKMLHRQYPDNPEKVMEWVIEGLEAKYLERLAFWTESKEEFQKMAAVETIKWADGRKIPMVTLRSDDEGVSNFAFSRFGANAAVVIQQKSTGYIQIHTGLHYGLQLYDLAQMVRLEEQKLTKRGVVLDEWRALSAEGTLKEVPEWCFVENQQKLLNGSLTAPNVPVTRLSLKRVQALVRIGLNPSVFVDRWKDRCEAGVCMSSRSNPCPFFAWGLRRCRQVRRAEKEKRAKAAS